jgi:N-acetylglutamate synthase-like GNAT family acetyltransferase
MNIREAQTADYPTILELHIDSIKTLCSVHYSEECISVWTTSRKLEHYKNIPGVEALIVGEEDHGKIIGFSRLDIKERCLTGLFVAPGQTGKNYGKRLLNRTEEIARSYGIEELLLYSTLNAMKFYHHMGYAGTTKEIHKMRSGIELLSVKMSKKLI